MFSTWRALPLFTALLCILLPVSTSHGTGHAAVLSDVDGIFESITPSSRLVWHTCTELFLCARLSLPLDPAKPELGDVALALIMYPGEHNDTSDNTAYNESPVLLNPGGPGGSGVEFIFRRGEQLRKILGSDVDIVSFDPRGIAHSTPSLDCFSSQLDTLTTASIRRQLWAHTDYNVDPYGVDDDSTLNTVYHRNSAKSQLCAAKDEQLGQGSIFKYASTPYVANDMIGIVDAWSQWRTGKQSTIDVNFWGFSYGSLLGSTFAAMFPNRVGKVMIDGIVDSKKWWDGELIGDYIDAEKILGRFAVYCEAAGSLCSFYQPGNSAKDIDTRLHKVLHALQRSPIAVVDRKNGMPAVITHGYIMGLIFMSLYKPMTEFPAVAEWMAAIESGNLTRMGKDVRLPAFALANQTELQHLSSHPLVSNYNEGNDAVICGDQQNRTDLDRNNVKRIFRDSRTFTTNFTSDVLRDIFGCIDWDIKPSLQLPSSLYLDTDSKDFVPVKTKNPIIVASTSLDPICPFRGALAMVPRFENASLIEVESEGHCSVSRASLCAAKAIRHFFKSGETPYTDLANGKWLRCKADEAPWFPFNGSAALISRGRLQTVLSSGMQVDHERSLYDELVEAWKSLGEVLPGL